MDKEAILSHAGPVTACVHIPAEAEIMPVEGKKSDLAADQIC